MIFLENILKYLVLLFIWIYLLHLKNWLKMQVGISGEVAKYADQLEILAINIFLVCDLL